MESYLGFGISDFRLQLDLDNRLLLQCAEKLSERLLRLCFIIVRLNFLFNLLKRRRVSSLPIEELDEMETEIRSNDPTHLSNLKTERLLLKGRKELSFFKKAQVSSILAGGIF
jgi:hypothetical protein